jgi:hypothetical protein
MPLESIVTLIFLVINWEPTKFLCATQAEMPGLVVHADVSMLRITSIRLSVIGFSSLLLAVRCAVGNGGMSAMTLAPLPSKQLLCVSCVLVDLDLSSLCTVTSMITNVSTLPALLRPRDPGDRVSLRDPTLTSHDLVGGPAGVFAAHGLRPWFGSSLRYSSLWRWTASLSLPSLRWWWHKLFRSV